MDEAVYKDIMLLCQESSAKQHSPLPWLRYNCESMRAMNLPNFELPDLQARVKQTAIFTADCNTPYYYANVFVRLFDPCGWTYSKALSGDDEFESFSVIPTLLRRT